MDCLFLLIRIEKGNMTFMLLSEKKDIDNFNLLLPIFLLYYKEPVSAIKLIAYHSLYFLPYIYYE